VEECKAVATHSNFRAEAVQVDVTQEGSVKNAVSLVVQLFGRVDYCVNSAGVSNCNRLCCNIDCTNLCGLDRGSTRYRYRGHVIEGLSTVSRYQHHWHLPRHPRGVRYHAGPGSCQGLATINQSRHHTGQYCESRIRFLHGGGSRGPSLHCIKACRTRVEQECG
jgi:hypothetical protein